MHFSFDCERNQHPIRLSEIQIYTNIPIGVAPLEIDLIPQFGYVMWLCFFL